MSKKQERKENIAYQAESPELKRPLWSWLGTQFGNLGEWGGIVSLFMMLGIVVWSVEQAKWITPQPSLILVLVLALLAGLLLIKSRMPGIATHLLAVVLGAGVAVWQGANQLSGLSVAIRVTHLIEELQTWWQATSSGAPSPGAIQVTLMFVYLIWLIGYVSIWFLLRRQNAWVAVFLGGAGLLINLSNLTEKSYNFFYYFLLAALFLVALTTLAKHYSWLGKYPIHYLKRGRSYFLVSVFCLSIVTLSLVSLTPEFRVYPLENLVRTKMPWRESTEEHWRNFFAAVRAEKPILIWGSDSTLRFEGSVELGDQTLFFVNSERPRYWRTQIYDIYTSRGWLTNPKTDEVLGQGVVKAKGVPFSRSSELPYTVTPQVYTDVLLTTGELISSNIPTVMKVLSPLIFDISLSGSSGNVSLPPDLASLASALRADLAGKLVSESELASKIPGDLTLLGVRRSSEQISGIRLVRKQSGTGDIATLSSLRSLQLYQRYTVTAQVSSATPAELSQANDNYPRWLTDRYLQLPSNFPERIRQLAKTITKDATTAYAKAVAIREFLYEIPYSLVIQAPPSWADGVDYFLFNQKAGYCVYFASAMAVMLRSVGVPARLNVGYLPGQWDEKRQGYIISDADFHAWPEIYFPSYGWIEFEATPGRGIAALEEDLPVIGEDDISDEIIASPDADVVSFEWLTANLPWASLSIVLLILVLGLAFYRRRPRFTGLSTAGAIYGRMCLLASLGKLGPRPQQTALEYAGRLSAAFPQQAASIGSITQIYVATKYSRNKSIEVLQKQRLQESWRHVRRALLRHLFHMK